MPSKFPALQTWMGSAEDIEKFEQYAIDRGVTRADLLRHLVLLAFREPELFDRAYMAPPPPPAKALASTKRKVKRNGRRRS